MRSQLIFFWIWSFWNSFLLKLTLAAWPLVPRWIQMSGKQNYKNSHISTFYAQNIFCFDVFDDFEFQNFVFGAWIVFHQFVFFLPDKNTNWWKTIQAPRTKFWNSKSPKTSKQEMFWEYFLRISVSWHTIKILLC